MRQAGPKPGCQAHPAPPTPEVVRAGGHMLALFVLGDLALLVVLDRTLSQY